MKKNNTLYFFTATILEWKHLLKDNNYKVIITDTLKFLCTAEKIKVCAFVIMPNHIHLIVAVGTGFCSSESNQPSESNQSDDQKVVPTIYRNQSL